VSYAAICGITHGTRDDHDASGPSRDVTVAPDASTAIASNRLPRAVVSTGTATVTGDL
jgi:hypothetical protein